MCGLKKVTQWSYGRDSDRARCVLGVDFSPLQRGEQFWISVSSGASLQAISTWLNDQSSGCISLDRIIGV